MQENQDSIRVRLCPSGKEVSVDMPQLIDWISSGNVTKDDLVRGDMLTNGVWKAFKDMRIYYMTRNEPVPDWIGPLEPYPGAHSAESLDNLGRYPVLKIISIIFKVISVFMVFCSVIGAVFFQSISSYAGASDLFGGAAFIVILFRGIFAALFLWALAELILLLIDIEANTRRTKADNSGL
jgi:hypothetical protein